MFAENIIQAAIEQVKTTRSTPCSTRTTFGTGAICVLVYSTSEINGTNITKVAFTTRYVPGANFLGSSVGSRA